MQIHIQTDDPERFILRYEAAFGALSKAAAHGSDDEHINDPAIASYRAFFPDPSFPDQAARRLESWRSMSAQDRALTNETVRWDIHNVLYMLGPEMRTWRHGGIEIAGPSSVILKIEKSEHPSATGVIHQIVECAGGRIVKEESRAGWLSSFLARVR